MSPLRDHPFRIPSGLLGFAQRIGRASGDDRPAVHQPAQSRPGDLPLDRDFLHRIEHLSLLARLPASGGVGGDHRSRARASSTDFADYRDYTPGDDFRRIDWNVFGRLGDLYVKLTEAREHLHAYILVDCSASMDWGHPNKLAFARAMAAALGYLALVRNDVVSIVCLGYEDAGLPGLRGRSRMPDLLSFLRQLRPCGPADLATCLRSRRLGPHAVNGRLGGQALVLSDLLAPSGLYEGLEHLLEARLDVVVVHVLSPQEMEPEPGGDLELVDAETGETVQVGLSMDAISQYKRRLHAWLGQVEHFCWRRGIRYVRVRSDEPMEKVMFDSLRRGGVVA